jgi:hypothetical protein
MILPSETREMIEMNATLKTVALAREQAVVALERAHLAQRAAYAAEASLTSVLQAADAVYADADATYEAAEVAFETVMKSLRLTQEAIDAMLRSLGCRVFNPDAEIADAA